jgi:uncharacterized membrane protein
MPMLMTFAMVLVILFLPRLLVLATNKVPFLNTLGSVFLCYALGLALAPLFKAGGADMSLASTLSSVLVVVAMPLILFSADLPGLKKLAKPMLISFTMNAVAVLVVAFSAYFLFRGVLPTQANHISSMLVGDYTGGTPNLFAIGAALGAPQSQILLLNTADMIGGGIYFFMLLSFMGPLLRKFLPKYVPVHTKLSAAEQDFYVEEFSGKKKSVKPWKSFMTRVGLVGLSVLCFVVAVGVVLMLPSAYGKTGLGKLDEYVALIMLIVTTLGIALSFVKKVRTAPGSYGAGQYFILMFSVIMGLSFDFDKISAALAVLGMLCFVQFGTVLLHILMAKIGKIDADTMLITSTAGVFGPAFIVPVAGALKNDEIILPGILCGILGYALGNYLGIGLGNILSFFG